MHWNTWFWASRGVFGLFRIFVIEHVSLSNKLDNTDRWVKNAQRLQLRKRLPSRTCFCILANLWYLPHLCVRLTQCKIAESLMAPRGNIWHSFHIKCKGDAIIAWTVIFKSIAKYTCTSQPHCAPIHQCVIHNGLKFHTQSISKIGRWCNNQVLLSTFWAVRTNREHMPGGLSSCNNTYAVCWLFTVIKSHEKSLRWAIEPYGNTGMHLYAQHINKREHNNMILSWPRPRTKCRSTWCRMWNWRAYLVLCYPIHNKLMCECMFFRVVIRLWCGLCHVWTRTKLGKIVMSTHCARRANYWLVMLLGPHILMWSWLIGEFQWLKLVDVVVWDANHAILSLVSWRTTNTEFSAGRSSCLVLWPVGHGLRDSYSCYTSRESLSNVNVQRDRARVTGWSQNGSLKTQTQSCQLPVASSLTTK